MTLDWPLEGNQVGYKDWPFLDTCGDACWWEYAAGDLSPQLQKPYKNMCRHLLCAGTNLIYMFTMDVYIYVYNYIYTYVLSCLCLVPILWMCCSSFVKSWRAHSPKCRNMSRNVAGSSWFLHGLSTGIHLSFSRFWPFWASRTLSLSSVKEHWQGLDYAM